MPDFDVSVKLSPASLAHALCALPKDEAAYFARLLGRALIACEASAELAPGDFLALLSKTYWQERKGRFYETAAVTTPS